MSFANQPRGTLFAVALIVAGAILFLDNIGILPIEHIGAYWPIAFVVYGIGLIMRKTSPASMIWSTTLIAFGALLTLGNLGIIHATIAVAWPLLLIALGFTALLHRSWWASKWPEQWSKGAWEPGKWGQWKWQDQAYATKHQWRQWKREHRRRRYREFTESGYSENNSTGTFINQASVFFSANRRLDGREVLSGELVAVFGSVEIDFTGATIPLSVPEGSGDGTSAAPVRRAEIEATAVFGSVEIRVPQTWRVLKEGAGVFGSYEDRTLLLRPEPGVEPPTLVVRGGAVFGSVTIEN